METTKIDVLKPERKPWGRYLVAHKGPQTVVKILVVAPGHELSLQTHEHRDEEWTLLDDNGSLVLFTIGEYVLTAMPQGCYHVPRGTEHRITNQGPLPVKILEVITGYYDEDDITRLEDNYGRA